MRREWSRIGILCLVMAVVVSGIAGCSRPAPGREAQETQPPATEGEEVVGPAEGMPTPGETVISAVATVQRAAATAIVVQPTTEATAEATPEAPAVVEPLPTAELIATAVPTATQATSPAAGGEYTVYTVKRGDTLSVIAQRHNTSVKAIQQANNLKSNVIYSGQKLKIPTSGGSAAGGTSGSTGDSTSGCRYKHKVKKGEWVWQIARNYGVSPYRILEANGLSIKKANTIYPGQVLCIP